MSLRYRERLHQRLDDRIRPLGKSAVHMRRPEKSEDGLICSTEAWVGRIKMRLAAGGFRHRGTPGGAVEEARTGLTIVAGFGLFRPELERGAPRDRGKGGPAFDHALRRALA
jgi:hypothetical protein